MEPLATSDCLIPGGLVFDYFMEIWDPPDTINLGMMCSAPDLERDMDPHRARPSIQDVLTRQDVHRSSLVWDAPLAGEEVSGVLTCRHRNKGLLEVVGMGEVSTHISCDEASTPGTVPRSTCYRWKGAKITSEHLMHVLCTYRLSLTSLRPNQIVWEPYRNYLGSLPAYSSPFHGEMSYNDNYMVWFRPRTVRHITRETSLNHS
nr:hypothetical protein CFP56_74603 [Quercus suber]